MSYKATLRVWRGDAGAGDLADYQVEVNEGEVVLDVLHRLQATQANDLAIRWNCKAGKCGSCSMEINGRPRLGVHDPDVDLRRGRDADHHPDAHLPGDPGPGHGRVVQLREGPADPVVHPGPVGQARRVPDAAGRRAAVAGVPQVHRVLPVPEHLPRDPRPRGERAAVRRPAVPDADRRAGDAPGRCRRPARDRAGGLRPRATATSPSAAPRSARRTSRSPTTR